MKMSKSCHFYKRNVTFVKFSGENSERVVDMKIVIANARWETV